MKDIVTKVSAAWAMIGTLLITFGVSGLPSWVPEIFSPEFTSVLVIALGAVIDFYQAARLIFAAKPESGVQTLSAGQKFAFVNPFKLP